MYTHCEIESTVNISEWQCYKVLPQAWVTVEAVTAKPTTDLTVAISVLYPIPKYSSSNWLLPNITSITYSMVKK